MKYTNEQLSAFLDGELPEKLMAEIAAERVANEILDRKLLALENANQAVKSAYEEIIDEPIPSHILNRIDEENSTIPAVDIDNVVPFTTRLANFSVSKWAAPLAATLAIMLGITIGRGTMFDANNNMLYAQLTGTITTENPLYDVLETSPSAISVSLANQDDVKIKPILTFQAKDGGYCREFQAQSKVSALRGVACRNEMVWTMVLLTQTEISQEDRYHTASGGTNTLTDQLIDNLIAGDPLGKSAESRLLANGWKHK